MQKQPMTFHVSRQTLDLRSSVSSLGVTGLLLALAARGRMLVQIQSQRGKMTSLQRTSKEAPSAPEAPPGRM